MRCALRALVILPPLTFAFLVLPSPAQDAPPETHYATPSPATTPPSAAMHPAATGPAFDTWAAYRARWNAILTATIHTTDTVRMLRTPLDPIEAPLTIYTEGKIDRLHLRAKANILLDFGGMQLGMQMKASPAATHTLQRSVLVLNGRWMPVRADAPTTTTEHPQSLLLDLMMLPDPNAAWSPIGTPEEGELDVDGCPVPATFLTFCNADDTMAVSISVDGRAVRSVRVLHPSGSLRSVGKVLSFSRDPLLGLVPRKLVFRQFDEHGQPYRDLHGVVAARFNEPAFEYLFD